MSNTSGFKGSLANVYAFLGDWEMTDTIIQTDFANQPAMTSEIYPNEHQARIVLTGLHPEYNTWWGGRIKETQDTDSNTLWDALHRWVNVTAQNETFENEYNDWISHRCVSWVAKIPDNDFPPIYGPSQVCDIAPYQQQSDVTIFGCSETAEGLVSLELYYRYSSDNITWNPWRVYAIDHDSSDGWSWQFHAPNGSGYYQFHSIRCVSHDGYLDRELSPPGPDASVFFIQK